MELGEDADQRDTSANWTALIQANAGHSRPGGRSSGAVAKWKHVSLFFFIKIKVNLFK